MLSIATINTWKCEGDYLKRLSILVKELELMKIQIILVQEAFQSVNEKYNTSRFLSKHLGFSYVSTQSRLKKRMFDHGNLESYSNVSIISQFPIMNWYIVPLPSGPEDGGRDAIVAEILVNNKILLFISVHLSHLRNGESLRKQQFLHILNQDFMQKAYDGIFIGGDFNTPLNESFLDELTNHHFRYDDTFIYRKKLDGIDYTFSFKNKFRKIDHIVQISKIHKPMLEIIDSEIIMSEKDSESGTLASDHYGVMTLINV